MTRPNRRSTSCARGSPRWRRRRRVGDLAARPDEIAAAEALIVQNEANLAQARKRLADLMPVAPEDALVENTFFNVGEWVPAGTPVVSLLPAVARKAALLRARGGRRAGRSMGRKVSFTCDGCPPDLKATIIYVSPRAEFTPPVIYSQSARDQAGVPGRGAARSAADIALAPGLPVSVAPLRSGGQPCRWRSTSTT